MDASTLLRAPFHTVVAFFSIVARLINLLIHGLKSNASAEIEVPSLSLLTDFNVVAWLIVPVVVLAVTVGCKAKTISTLHHVVWGIRQVSLFAVGSIGVDTVEHHALTCGLV